MKIPTVITVAFTASFATATHAMPAVAADSPPKATESAPAADKKIDWDHMSKAERKKYMKTTVLPKMKALFVEFDAKQYKRFNCETCHGKDAADKEYKMPNPDLPKLPQPTDRAAFMALQQKKPEAVKFMGTKVKPTLASLLGLPEWTPQNPNGFGCYGCHTKEGEESRGTPAKAPDAKAGAPKPAAGSGW